MSQVYSITQLLDLAHSPLVKTPAALEQLDASLFQAPTRAPVPHTPREIRGRKPHNNWKKPAFDEVPGMELAAKAQEPASPPPSEVSSPPRKQVDLWEGNINFQNDKGGSSRFSSFFGPNKARAAPVSNPQGPTGPVHVGPSGLVSSAGLVNQGGQGSVPSPLNSMPSLQNSLPGDQYPYGYSGQQFAMNQPMMGQMQQTQLPYMDSMGVKAPSPYMMRSSFPGQTPQNQGPVGPHRTHAPPQAITSHSPSPQSAPKPKDAEFFTSLLSRSQGHPQGSPSRPQVQSPGPVAQGPSGMQNPLEAFHQQRQHQPPQPHQIPQPQGVLLYGQMGHPGISAPSPSSGQMSYNYNGQQQMYPRSKIFQNAPPGI